MKQKMKDILKNKVFIVTFIFVAVVSVFVYVNIPKDIGGRLHYIGRKDYGCMPFPFFFVCFNDPGSVYYYSTDLTQDELKTYFTKAQFAPNEADGGGFSANYNFDHLHFKKDDEEFVFSYYDNTQAVLNDKDLKGTGHPYVISIGDFDYDLARSSL